MVIDLEEFVEDEQKVIDRLKEERKVPAIGACTCACNCRNDAVFNTRTNNLDG